MDTVFKVAYSLVVAILFILFAILGQRTFYDEPDPPQFPRTSGVSPNAKTIFCDGDGSCFVDNTVVTPEVEASLSDDEREFLDEQREITRLEREHEEDRTDYFRNVFLLTAVLGVAAVAVGCSLFRRIEALPLGLLLGGIGIVIYGWVESSRGPDEALGTGVLFAVVAVGLVAVMGAGYWIFGGRRGSSEDTR